MEDVFQSSYYNSPLGYNNVDCFVNEVIKLENKMAFYFVKTNKDIIMTEENEEKITKIINFVDFVRKTLNVIKFEINVIFPADTEVQLVINVI